MASKATFRTLFSVLYQSSTKADHFANHLIRLLSTSSGQDSVLLTIHYTLHLLHSQLTRILSRRYEKLAISIASKASQTMLPGETLVATIEPPHLALTEWCARTREAADAAEDARMLLRLFGLLRIYGWAKETWTKGTRDPVIKLLTWCRIFSSVGYQFFENGAYLASKGILSVKMGEKRDRKWWVWSSRLWLATLGLEYLKLMRVRQLRYNEDWGAESKRTDEDMSIQSKRLEQRWWRSLYANLGWVPGAIRYSFYDDEKSPVGEAWAGAALVPALISLEDAWRETEGS